MAMMTARMKSLRWMATLKMPESAIGPGRCRDNGAGCERNGDQGCGKF